MTEAKRAHEIRRGDVISTTGRYSDADVVMQVERMKTASGARKIYIRLDNENTALFNPLKVVRLWENIK